MDWTRLQELKQKMLHDKEFGPVWSFFLTHFGENPDFIALGDRTDHPFLEAVIAEVGRQLFPGDSAVSDVLLTRVPQPQFIHGAFRVGGRLGMAMYFEDARAGMLAITDHPPSIEVKYTRFSGRPAAGRG